jgi:hypothetical protein
LNVDLKSSYQGVDKVDNLVIDPEFKNLIPPLTTEEYKQLEENLIKEGCRDALVVWNGILVDGHNRYEICSQNNITYKIETKGFENRGEVKEWIIRNQFGRRNITLVNRVNLALTLEEVVRARAKEKMLSTQNNKTGAALLPVGKQTEKIHTDDELAKIAGVSHDAIRWGRIVQEEATPEQKERLAKGEAKLKTIFKEIRPSKPKEEPPVMQPDKPEFEEKEELPIMQSVPEESGEEEKRIHPYEVDETGFPIIKPIREAQESIFSISKFKAIVNSFITEINPLEFGGERFGELSKIDLKKYLSLIKDIKNQLNGVEKAIKQNLGGTK